MKNLIIFLMLFLSIQTSNAQDFWEKTNFLGQSSGNLIINPDGYLFAGNSNFGIMRSKDDGDTWTFINEGLTVENITELTINPKTGSIFAAGFNLTGTENNVFRSTNNGNSWEKLIPLSNLHYGISINLEGKIFAINSMGGNILTSTDDGKSWESSNWKIPGSFLEFGPKGYIYSKSGNKIYRSTDGVNWLLITNRITNLSCGGITFNSAGDIFLTQYAPGEFGLYGAICRSTNNGDTWTIVWPVSLGTMGPIAINDMDNIYAASSFVIHSTNNGNTWKDVSTGLPHDPGYFILSLVFNKSGRLFALSGDGVYRSIYLTTALKKYPNEILSSFSLEQNYPNPFNPTTIIKYSIPSIQNPLSGGARGGLVTLKVYDILGREVATLVNETKAPGHYEVNFNAANLSSGVYFYQLKILDPAASSKHDFIQTKKMLLLK